MIFFIIINYPEAVTTDKIFYLQYFLVRLLNFTIN